MKRINTLYLLLLLSFAFIAPTFGQKPEHIVRDIRVQTDYVENGVKGIRISATCDYSILKKKYATDSLLLIALRQGKFLMRLNLYQDSTSVKPAFGYQSAFSKKRDVIEWSHRCNPEVSDSKPKESVYTFFIPYAAMKLTEGKQDLVVSADLNGKDGFNNTYKQTTHSAVFSFNKPLTKLFECTLDSLVVKPFNKEGQAWDHELFGTDAPDLDFSLKMGDLEVGNVHKGNAYFISFAEKPRVFRFLISENDEVTIYLSDTDDAFNDPIASWRFNSSNMKEGTVYEQKESKANMESFSFKCKVGKVKN